jgi:hypothetical protein
MLIEKISTKFSLLLFLVFALNFSFLSQQHTFTSFSPSFAGTGDIVTLRGTNLTGVTGVTFGGTAASSFTIVNSTTIRAVVGAGTTGSISITKPSLTTQTRSGFTYSALPTVTEIITDYGSFWRTSTTTNSPIWPDNSHNLLSFSYKNTTYSTGVNDGILISNGITYTAGNFKALPVELQGTTKGGDNLIVAGSKVDGNSTTAISTHVNIKDLTMQSVVIDGIKGLDLGTGYTNLPTGASSNYFITNINVSKIADDEPDIIVTQIAEPTGTATDTYRFLDASNNVVGNPVQVSLSALTALGTYRLDLFSVAAGQTFSHGKPNGVWQTNSTRPIRFVGFRLSDFGITGSNYSQIKTLQITPSGVSDVAFVAYNANAIDALPVVQIDVTTTNTVICGGGLGGPAQLGITASSPSGDPLAYRWQESLDNGITWNDVFDGGVYSGATTQVLQLSSGTTGRKYRTKVTATISGYIIYSPEFTITEIAATPLTGTLNPTGFTNCIDPTSGTTSLSVAPTGGTGTYTYVWETSTSISGPFTVIPGADENTYTPNLSVAGTNYFRVKITSGCYNNTSTVATVTINGDIITSVTDGTRCNTGTVGLSAAASGGTISWFNVPTAGTALATGTTYTTPSIATTTTYYVSTTSSGCTSPRVPVNAIVTSGTTLTSSNFEIIFSSDVCAGSGSSVSMATSGLVNGTYTVNYTISGANSLTSSASVTFNDGYGSFTTGTLSNTGANTLTINNFQIGGCTITVSSGNTSTINVFSGIPDVGDLAVSVTDGCSNIQSIATLTSTTLANGTYVVDYAITGTNSLSSTSQVVFTSGVGTFSLPILNTVGSANVLTIQSISLLSSPTCIGYPGISSSAFSSNAETTLNSGSDVYMCTTGTSENITAGSSASNYNALSWSTSGTGSFTNNTTVDALTNTTYTPSVADKTAGSVILTLNATANAGCQNQNRAITFYINPLSVGGTIAGSATVCASSNSTTLTLSGHTGSITRWEYSAVSDFSSGVTTVANTTTTLTITNLSATRYYRAVITSGLCSSTYSSTATITVNATSVGGSLAGNATVCSGTNSTTFTLSGHTGNVTRWEWSLVSDFSSGVNTVANVTTSLTATNLTATRYYRAVVTNGVCSAANSTTGTVTVSPTSVGGTIAGGTTVCTGTNSTTLTLSGHTGSVTRWEWSAVSDFSSGVNTVANVTTTLTAANLTATRFYRAVVTSGVCSSTNSGSATITVSPTSVSGSVSGGATVCSGTNSTTLTLTGNTGAIQWQSSTNDITFNNIGGATSSTYAATDLTATTYFRVVATSGACSAANTNSVAVIVDPTSVAGTISGNTAACNGTNSTTLTLSGNTGSIQWQSSTNNVTYNNISGETSATYTASNLSSTTYYKAVVTSGVCGAATTAAHTITVVNPSISDPSITSGDYVWRGSDVNSTDSVDWLVPTNWYVYDGSNYNVAATLPTKLINVFIPGVGTCFKANPHIFTSTAPESANLTILSSGHLTMHTGKLSVAGNWVNNGTFTCGTGEVIFIEEGYHTIGGTVSVNAFYDFRMNKPADGPTKSVAYLLKQATIAGKMTLDLGLFDINVFSIDMDDREIVGGSNASYVRTSSTGFLKRYVGSAYDNMQSGYVRFPVGRGNFNQARLNNAGTSDKFSVRLFDIVSDDSEETSPMTSLPVVERTWIIEEQTIGGSDVDMQLYWNGTVESRIEELNDFDYNTAYIAHYDKNSPTWENKGGSAPSGPGYAQQNGITSFSPFAISSSWGLGYISPLPVELLDFTATCLEDNSVQIDWSTASENNSSHFEVRKSLDGYTWNTIETIPAAGNSTSLLEYSILDRNKTIGNTYYRLNQVDIDGKSELFDVVTSNCVENELNNLLTTYPNPSTNEFYVEFNSEDIEGEAIIEITDSRGVIVYKRKIQIEKGTNFFTIGDIKTQEGIYYIHLQRDNFKSNMVKQVIR